MQPSEVDAGGRNGVTTDEAQRMKDLEREVKELRRADEIVKLASASFDQAVRGCVKVSSREAAARS